MNLLVFDTSAILAYFKGEEPEASDLEQIMLKLEQKEAKGIISTITMTEVYYILASESPERGEERFDELEKSVLIKVPVDVRVAKETGKLKAKYKISMADCVIAGTAIIKKAGVVASQKDIGDFKKIEKIKALLPKEALKVLKQ